MRSKLRALGHMAAMVAFWLWIPALVLPGAYFLGSHLLALPKPSLADSKTEAAIAGLRNAADRGKWLAVHVLFADCPCSQRIFNHLLERRAETEASLAGAKSGIAETILLVGDDVELGARARTAGFTLETVPPEELKARYDIEAVPILILADDTNSIRYVGGYTSSKQGPKIEDVEIIARTRSGETVAPLPVFGCAVSRQLQSIVDPLGLK